MKTTDIFDYNTDYGSYRCHFEASRYMNNDNLALQMVDAEDEEPICIVTVNPMHKIPDGSIAVKNYSENTGMVDFLKELGIMCPKVKQIYHSGWVDIPVFDLTESGKELFKGV